jgi:hypothetical protein
MAKSDHDPANFKDVPLKDTKTEKQTEPPIHPLRALWLRLCTVREWLRCLCC